MPSEGGRVVAHDWWVFGKPHTLIHCLLTHHGGIVPAARRRALLALTLTEREEISRGIASGSSIRDIAKRLVRPRSAVSREVAGHGGGPAYRTDERGSPNVGVGFATEAAPSGQGVNSRWR